MSDATCSADSARPLKPALLKGLRLRCPCCGDGPLLYRYLKPHAQCSECGLDLSHQRADDGPAYLTILIVGHLMGVLLHVSYVAIRPEPLTLALSMAAFATLSALLLLPRVKGMIIAYQWAKGMHGF